MNLAILAFFTLLSYVYKGWHPGFASTFIFSILAALMLYEGMVFLTSFYKLNITRLVAKKRLQAGGTQVVTIKLARGFRFPLAWYAVHELWPGNLPPVPGQVFFPWFKKEIDITFELPQLARGAYDLKEITVVCGDLFGIFKAEKTIKLTDRFLVYPKYDLLQKWTAKDGQKSGQASIARRHSDELTSVVGIREYAFGDRLNQIHWKATAKSQTLKTKEFEYQVSQYFAVFLDSRQGAYPDSRSFEKAIQAAASLSNLGFKKQLKFALLIEGSPGKAKMLEGAQGHDFYRVLEELSALQAEGKAGVEDLVKQALPLLPRGAQLAIVTGRIDRSLSLLLAELAHKQTKVELFCSSNEESEESHRMMNKLQGSGVILHRVWA
ncbi:DUF58 domain-containing protein [Ammoniphilus sp. 3BR4]|uniref:DUF58 domain-containing protein n=1 Tax=Ammoniphilus sp. 3BR4 TaxID=3158265 RepID=UPI003467DC25